MNVSSEKIHTYRGVFDSKATDFDPCIKILIVRDFQIFLSTCITLVVRTRFSQKLQV